MTDPDPTPEWSEPVRAILVSVGGAAAPILHTLRHHRPPHVWYFCSAGSRVTADEIHGQLDWHPDRDFIEVERFEELGPCYRALRVAIPGLLKQWRLAPADVLVDYTGGTKTMSVALGLAATEVFSRFSYVGGTQREKSGLGVTIEGRERAVYHGNPWSELAIREIEQCSALWEHGLFEAVAANLREVADKVPRRLRFETIARLAEGMAARHRLDFKAAEKAFGRVTRDAPALFDGQDDAGLMQCATDSLTRCSECAKDRSNATLLRELLDNALRTAAQGRYEDAAGRLYRAMEMQGQLWLEEATDGVFRLGRAPSGADLPTPIARVDFVRSQVDAKRDVRLSMEQVYLALHALGDSRAASLAGDLALDRKSRWRQGTEQRNTSILGHGVAPIGADGFDRMKSIATEFLGFDLTGEAHPIPPLHREWF